MKKTSLLLALCCCASTLVGAPVPREKMVWAHLVGWAFPQLTYDEAGGDIDTFNSATDRTLLGRYTQTVSGLADNARPQIESARRYGIDGFCIDLVDPRTYVGAIGRFYSAAEGTDFKIALCMDNYVRRSPAECVTHLADFIRRYKDHPNSARIDGRMVVFLYNTGMSMAEWAGVRAELRKQNLDAFFIDRAMPETSMWNNPDTIAASLTVNDGLYDFGCNGFTPAEMKQRLKNMTDALKSAPGKVLIAGAAPGYLGRGVGNYRPFLNTASFRDNWETILANPRVDQVCVTTWNDYTETTHLEPSVVNRDALTRLNQEYARIWKKQSAPPRPPQVIFSYHEEVIVGDDLTIEAVNFSYSGDMRYLYVRLLDAAGKLFHAFPPVALPAGKLTATTFRLPYPLLKNTLHYRVQAALGDKDDPKPAYKELYPILRRPARVESQRTVRMCWDGLATPQLELRLEKDNRAKALIRSWTAAGTLELLRNGFPVAEIPVNHTGKPIGVFSFELPAFPRSGRELYLLRYTDVAQRVGFSNSVERTFGSDRAVDQSVIESGSDFDENWPLWNQPHSRLKAPRMVTAKVPENAQFELRYRCDEGEGKVLRSDTNWNLSGQLGIGGRGFAPLAGGKTAPEWVKGIGPDGTERPLLRFFGESIVSLPVRTMPGGVFTMEFDIKPEATGKPAVLFGEQRRLSVELTPEFAVKVCDLDNPDLVSKERIPAGEWSRLTVVNSGNRMRVFRNGREIASAPRKVQGYYINSSPALGNQSRKRVDGFVGLLGGFSLSGSVRVPGEIRDVPGNQKR